MIVLIVHVFSLGISTAAFSSDDSEDGCDHPMPEDCDCGCCGPAHKTQPKPEGEPEEDLMGYSGIENDNCCGDDPNCWFRFDHNENEDISPNPAEVGETVTISGEVQHYNGQAYSKACISLYIDGTEVDSHVTNELGWNETESFSFQRTEDTAGTYDVDLYVFYYDGGVVGAWHQRWSSTLEVVEADEPQFELSGWSVSPSTVEPDETVTIEG
ncbi:MAG: hypothetical protein ACLFVL_07755, partial [Candidatus Aenigmatarchaeota archaeon]